MVSWKGYFNLVAIRSQSYDHLVATACLRSQGYNHLVATACLRSQGYNHLASGVAWVFDQSRRRIDP